MVARQSHDGVSAEWMWERGADVMKGALRVGNSLDVTWYTAVGPTVCQQWGQKFGQLALACVPSTQM